MSLEAWMALAWRSPLAGPERWKGSRGAGPREEEFPPEVIERERADLATLVALGVRMLRNIDEEFPEGWRGPDGPIVIHVAGRASLLREPGVEFVAGVRRAEGERLVELIDRGARACVFLAKGLLSAKSEMRGLAEQIADGTVALVSAEPPRAAWGPIRERRRKELLALLR